ncbi:hypothetical protein AAMO2058_001410200 [Amorphochlora amoebiformis]
MWHSFDFQTAPLSGLEAPLVASAVYLASTLYLKRKHENTEIDPKQLALRKSSWSGVQASHNLLLCVCSLAMFLGCLYEVLRRTYVEASLTWFVCEHASATSTGPLYFWSYVYYLSKFYELADTYIAYFRGSPPPFIKMHIYHHSVVLFMTWFWLRYQQSLQFGGLLFNTFVHVVMYYYYYLRARGIVPTWKNKITRLQILQFVFSGMCAVPWGIAVLSGAQCKGTPQVIFNFAFNVSLLVLFTGVLSTNSSKKRK